jgi:replicative DNA helicase|tara:strand:+ start:1591 stop:3066 length:1476 start_codon:yes stop_codon:yes gene_type:complete
MIYSIQIEKHVIGGLINNPSAFAEIDGFISGKDFFTDSHATIYNVIKSTLSKGEDIDKVIVAQKIKNLGISFKDDINIFDYLTSISFTQITEKATVKVAQELAKITVRRETYYSGKKLMEFAKSSGEKTINEFISGSDSIYNDNVSAYTTETKPSNIFDGIVDLIEDRSVNPGEDTGLLTSYEEFNRLFGGLRRGNLYAIAARPGQGKTTWINDLCFKIATKNKVKALVLDTEMSKEEMQFRLAAAISGIPVWYLETGNWRKNKEMVEKFKKAKDKLATYDYHHHHIGNKDIDQVCSLVKRWYYSEVGRGNDCVIAYDYVKLTGEKVDRNWAEYQAIGEKIDKLKKLSEELNCPIITAMQLNRSGEGHGRNSANITDDSSAISLSDRLQWFASYVGIFRRKSEDELALDGEAFGTHKLITLKSRFQGRNATGHHDLIKRITVDGSERHVNNYVNFDVDNFDVTERGSLRHIVEAQKERHDLDEGNDDGEIL